MNEPEKSDTSGVATVAASAPVQKVSYAIVELDNEDLSIIEKYSLDKLDKLEIFKNNPKLYARLKMVTGNDNFYEAQQLYKIIHFRCNVHNLVDESLVILFNGIAYFLRKKSQFLCGFDLAKAFVETLKSSKTIKFDDQLRSKIKIIHKLLRPGGEERNEFSLSVLKWSSSLFEKIKMDINDVQSIYMNYQKMFGHFDLHQDFAHNLWKERNYIQARYHFLHSMDARSFSQMIIECHLNFGYPSEYDLFLVQNVLLYLTLRNLRAASEFFAHYVSFHPSIRKVDAVTSAAEATAVIDCFESPLINFVQLLLITLKSHSLKTYQSLLEAYRPTLQRDTSLYLYLEKVTEHFYNVRKSNSGQAGLFSNLMRMLTTNMNEASANIGEPSEDDVDDEDDETGPEMYAHNDDDLLD